MMTKETNELFQCFFAICLLLVPAVFAGLERRCTHNTPVRGILCGDRLYDALSLVCHRYGGFSNGARKKSDPSVPALAEKIQTTQKTTDSGQKSLFQTNTPASIPSSKIRHVTGNFITRKMADSFLEKRDIHWQGITCECCNFRCRMSELREYCNYGPSDPDSDFFNM